MKEFLNVFLRNLLRDENPRIFLPKRWALAGHTDLNIYIKYCTLLG